MAARDVSSSGFRLTLGDQLPMLRLYAEPSVETPSAAWRFAWGPWGLSRWGGSMPRELRLELRTSEDLSWTPPDPHARWGLAHARPWANDAWSVQQSFAGADDGYFGTTDAPPSFWSYRGWTDAWTIPECKRAPVRFTRYQSESEEIVLLDCDGSVSSEAVDRLSVMARPPGVDRPELPLPDRPSPDANEGEWVPSVRLLNPRLVWLVQQLANAYPGRGIYIVSGYRTGAYEGVHGQGRALDLHVMGVANERVYRTCRKLRDVGCGYYPNHNFVHVDVRPAGTGSRYWIDVSEPGRPSRYVDSWPGVESGGWGKFDTAPEG